MKAIFIFFITLLLAGCQVAESTTVLGMVALDSRTKSDLEKNLEVTKAEYGLIYLSYRYKGALDNIEKEGIRAEALKRCQGWGFTDVSLLDKPVENCLHEKESEYETCQHARLDATYQCVSKAQSSNAKSDFSSTVKTATVKPKPEVKEEYTKPAVPIVPVKDRTFADVKWPEPVAQPLPKYQYTENTREVSIHSVGVYKNNVNDVVTLTYNPTEFFGMPVIDTAKAQRAANDKCKSLGAKEAFYSPLGDDEGVFKCLYGQRDKCEIWDPTGLAFKCVK